ncbi:uncharacterized protein K441DRAFT_315913 [Cenococcum geophilum 1.58]|uniref:uncharacterized protein n=1 Tax=Cenococcum geophilum 1.58 TaxID=794803 RepID=UPI00358F84BD|nr:hypothetical protein K441DRAFT_315913 [Cenococcum geophilum 1.58]
MASSYSTLSLAPSLFPTKYIPYVPSASKPKPKSKSKANAKTKTAEHNHSEAVSFRDSGEWFNIDDFPMPDSNASRPLILEYPLHSELRTLLVCYVKVLH